MTDSPTLVERLSDTLKLNFTGTGLESQYRRWIAPGLAVVQWAPIPDLSILGSINDMIAMARFELEERDTPPVELSSWLAESPMSALGGNSPDRVFPRLGR